MYFKKEGGNLKEASVIWYEIPRSEYNNMLKHQYFQIDSCPYIRLQKWYRIYSNNGIVQTDKKYVQFYAAWLLTGEVIHYEVPDGKAVIVEVEFTE